MRWVMLLICFAVLLSGCRGRSGPPVTPALSISEIGGAPSERLAAVRALLEKRRPLPAPLQDARFLEERIGDGDFGPSDYRAFYRLDLAAADLPAWQQVLTPLDKAGYHQPSRSTGWWLSFTDFERATLYQPDALTPRTDGWIALPPGTNTLFIYTFTR